MMKIITNASKTSAILVRSISPEGTVFLLAETLDPDTNRPKQIEMTFEPDAIRELTQAMALASMHATVKAAGDTNL